MKRSILVGTAHLSRAENHCMHFLCPRAPEAHLNPKVRVNQCHLPQADWLAGRNIRVLVWERSGVVCGKLGVLSGDLSPPDYEEPLLNVSLS